MSAFLFKNKWLKRHYYGLSGAEQLLILSALFSMGLIVMRFIITGELFLLMLPWNLFLAFIPFAVSSWLSVHIEWIENRARFMLAFAVWLLFIPNSFYIITDLFHLGQSHRAPAWYDLAVIFSFAWTGVFMGVLSVRMMQQIIPLQFSFFQGLFFTGPVMWLNALGVYIGRYLRYNSWDLLTNPFDLSADIFYLALHPLRNGMDWAMIFCYTILLTIIYESFSRLSKPVL